MARFGPSIGAEQLGGSVYELDPGESVCPYHYEHPRRSGCSCWRAARRCAIPTASTSWTRATSSASREGPDGAPQGHEPLGRAGADPDALDERRRAAASRSTRTAARSASGPGWASSSASRTPSTTGTASSSSAPVPNGRVPGTVPGHGPEAASREPPATDDASPLGSGVRIRLCRLRGPCPGTVPRTRPEQTMTLLNSSAR